MLNNKFTTGVLVTIISTAVLSVILVLIFMLSSNYPIQGTNLSVIEINVEDNSETEVEFKSLEFYPGKEYSYSIKIETQKNGNYEVALDFNVEEKSTLSDYVSVKVIDSNETILYDQLIKDTIEEDAIKVTYDLEKDNAEYLTVVYYMDYSVGNEAKNLELTLDLIITISEK